MDCPPKGSLPPQWLHQDSSFLQWVNYFMLHIQAQFNLKVSLLSKMVIHRYFEIVQLSEIKFEIQT